MFDRLERQASEFGRVQARADLLESELEQERQSHLAAARRLEEQSAELEQLRGQVVELAAEREAREQLATELADTRTVNDRLESHLGAAWQEVHTLRAELTRPWWRRRRKNATSRAWAHSFEARAAQP
jgi:chromosome segregation ATPase